MEKKQSTVLNIQDKIVLQLFISGMSPMSVRAVENVRVLCKDYLGEMCELEIIDIYKHPEVAVMEQIVFSPSLIKRLPLPEKTIIGTFTDINKVIAAVGLEVK